MSVKQAHKDFEPVFRFPDIPLVLLVPKSSPHKSAADLIAFAKKTRARSSSAMPVRARPRT